MESEYSEEKNIRAKAARDSEREYVHIRQVEIDGDVDDWDNLNEELAKDCVVIVLCQEISREGVLVVVNVPVDAPLQEQTSKNQCC